MTDEEAFKRLDFSFTRQAKGEVEKVFPSMTIDIKREPPWTEAPFDPDHVYVEIYGEFYGIAPDGTAYKTGKGNC